MQESRHSVSEVWRPKQYIQKCLEQRKTSLLPTCEAKENVCRFLKKHLDKQRKQLHEPEEQVDGMQKQQA